MQIHSLVLYGINGERRELKFNLNGVSIIAGDSATGKSSLIEIIDYCLGSGECRVPDGVIRENVAWYALMLVSGSNGQLFVARRSPDSEHKSTHQFVLLPGNNVRIPSASELTATHNLKDAIASISEFLGISPNETELPEDRGSTSYDITVRHAIKLCLQYQDEIASKRFLFHQQAEGFKAKAIYDSLPYLLGFQEDDYLDRLAQLRQAKKNLAQAQRRLSEYDSLAAGGLDVGQGLISESHQLGITEQADLPGTPEQLLTALDNLLSWQPDGAQPVNASDDTLTAMQQRLIRLERERQNLKAQLVSAESARLLVVETETEWKEQTARLSAIELFASSGATEITCPLCNQVTADTEAALPKFNAVQEQFRNTGDQLAGLDTSLPRINRFVANLREQVGTIDSEVAAARQSIRQLQRERDQLGTALDLVLRQAMLIGRVDQYLLGMRQKLGDGASLNKAVANAQAEVDRLEEGISTGNIKGQLRSVADQLQDAMTRWASDLKLEFAPEPFRINFEALTVEVSRLGYHLPLYRMGSGKNWLGCHLIAHFALQSYFISRKRPVPRFLFLDQPTQVFYPPDEVDRAGGETKGLKIRQASESDDRDIVQRIFRWIFQQTEELNKVSGFQVVVTDHAELQTADFQAALVDRPRWREGTNSLVPPQWLRS